MGGISLARLTPGDCAHSLKYYKIVIKFEQMIVFVDT